MGTTAYDGVETDITYRYDGTPTAVDFGIGGKSNYGARFNGSSSKIVTGFSLYDISTVSLSGWVNIDSLTSTPYNVNMVFGTTTTSNASQSVQVNSDGTVRFRLQDSTGENFSTTSTTLSVGQWHHLAVTWDKTIDSGKLKIYIDGTEASYSSTGNQTNNTNEVGDLVIGHQSSLRFDGSLDQVRIFSKALSSTEVGKLYGNGAGEIACAYTSTTDNLAYPIANTAYYKLDNNSKDSARSTGKFNEGAIFNGSSRIGTGITSFTNTFSLSMWLNPSSLPSVSWIFGNWNSTTQDIYIIANSSGQVEINFDGQSGGQRAFGSAGDLTLGNWTHFVVSMNSGNYEVYINGNSVGTYSTTNTTFDNGQDFEIGNVPKANSNPSWNGLMDQVRIYNTALDSTDVSNLYAETVSDTSTLSFPSGKTAIATYQLDGNSTDLSGNYNGTDTNVTYAYDGTESNIEYRFGRYGQAAVFNGSSSYITSNSLPSIGTGDFTFSCWFNQNSGNQQGALFSTTTQWFAANGYDGKVLMVTDDTVTKKGDTTYSQDTWNHAVFARESGVLKIYQNGTEVFSGAYTDSWDMTQFGIGVARAFGSRVYYFNGKIDQVRIYSTALTDSQVTQLYEEKPEVDTSNFKTVLYEGNSSTQYISNVGMDLETNGGLVWLKQRNSAQNHGLFDTVRGANSFLISNSTSNVNTRTTDTLSSFDANGFTLTPYSSDAFINYSGRTMVAWTWKGGGDDVLNEEGTIDSQVSANTEAGFSIVKYTGNGTGGTTAGHGLSYAPDIVITKGLDFPDVWLITGASIGNNDTNYLLFNTGAMGSSTTVGSSNATTLDIGTSTASNTNSKNFISYCFHSVAGYSKIGSYTGNGSSTGPIVTTGFEPKFIMIKRTDTSGYGWYIMDSARGMDGTTGKFLFANTSASEGTLGAGGLQPNSTGFQITDAGAGFNANLGTYIYMAFK